MCWLDRLSQTYAIVVVCKLCMTLNMHLCVLNIDHLKLLYFSRGTQRHKITRILQLQKAMQKNNRCLRDEQAYRMSKPS